MLLVSSFDLTGRTPKTDTRNQSYARFRKTLLEARSWPPEMSWPDPLYLGLHHMVSCKVNLLDIN
ncbi:hypothetical protein Hanom_Chr17g01530151 [Helianthus anomalus]